MLLTSWDVKDNSSSLPSPCVGILPKMEMFLILGSALGNQLAIRGTSCLFMKNFPPPFLLLAVSVTCTVDTREQRVELEARGSPPPEEGAPLCELHERRRFNVIVARWGTQACGWMTGETRRRPSPRRGINRSRFTNGRRRHQHRRNRPPEVPRKVLRSVRVGR